MKRFLIKSLAFMFLSFMAVGCGGGGGGTTTDGTTTTQTDVTTLKLVDIAGIPLAGAQVTVNGGTTSTKQAKATYTVGADGTVNIENGLEPGTYTLEISLGGVSTTATITIKADNFSEVASVMAGLEILADGVHVIEGAVIASISGIVTDTAGSPIHYAQVNVSGGVATNGSFASALTQADGSYMLLININADLLSALSNGLTITASADGYEPKSLTVQEVLQSISVAGLNFQLGTATTSTALYSETFDSGTNGWTMNKLSGDNDNNMWHLHSSSVTGINQAYTYGLVSLAPNDTSNGAIPAPASGNCMWYGNGNVADGATFGNFMDETTDTYALSGGTSSNYDNSGELISPAISLTGVTGAVHLTFDTWWEIESVNPNKDGFDLMTVAMSTDGGSTWTNIARLNPLSDPVSDLVRAPIPFSNTGFNSAPMWLTQEGITLPNAAGKTIQLKFTFETNDGLYNGFRGWLIDNVEIKAGEGTAPAYEEVYADEYYKAIRR